MHEQFSYTRRVSGGAGLAVLHFLEWQNINTSSIWRKFTWHGEKSHSGTHPHRTLSSLLLTVLESTYNLSPSVAPAGKARRAAAGKETHSDLQVHGREPVLLKHAVEAKSHSTIQ